MWYKKIILANELGGISKQKLDIPLSSALHNILLTLEQNGWRGLIVGGAVRDAITGHIPKDIDIEVYGPNFNQLAAVLKKYGHVLGGAADAQEPYEELVPDPRVPDHLRGEKFTGSGHSYDIGLGWMPNPKPKPDPVIGKAFGVIKFRDDEGNDYDFSLPRRDSKIGDGHTGFDIQVNPNMSPKEAASRRDFTFNSLAFDPLTSELHDYFGGKQDLENKILRATDMEKFGDDPLRVLRGMQFSARMGLTVDPETAKLAMHLANEIPDLYKSPENPNGISRERVTEEFMKLATKGKFPGSAIQYLLDTGWIKYFPQVQAIVAVPQEFEYHPEGPVHIHTAHVMNEAAKIADRRGLTGDDRAVAIFAALGHDFAKATTTEQREKDGKMRWTSYGHEEAGGPVVQEFLKSIGVKDDIISRVVPLVRKHLNHIQYKSEKIPNGTVRGLAHELYPSTIEDLVDLVEADHSGRPPLPKELPEQARWLLDAAKADNVHNRKPPQILTGKHMLSWFNGKAGPHIGKAVKDAYNAYLKGKYTTPEEADAWLRNYMKANAQLLKGQDVLPYFQGKGGPQVGQILDKAWDAQAAGEYADEAAAKAWLENYMKSFNQDA